MSEVHIDGDRVIAFINAIKDLSVILEQLNVIEVKDAFIHGKRLGSIESILETRKAWGVALAQIADELKKHGERLNADKIEAVQALNTIKSAQIVFNSSDSKKALDTAKEFVSVLDRLEYHNKAGTLKLMASITLPG